MIAAAVIACALNVLGRSHILVPVAVWSTPPPGVSANAEAFVSAEPVTINLIESSEAFQLAQRGVRDPTRRSECVKLASVIVHEEWHLSNGPDEGAAYLAQLNTLAALGAGRVMSSGVRRSMLVAVARQRRAHPQSPGHVSSAERRER